MPEIDEEEEEEPTHVGFAQKAYVYEDALLELERALKKAGMGSYARLGWDPYDNSLEIHGVDNDLRLSEAIQLVIHEAGFSRVYVNHKDKWETHYSWSQGFETTSGWRVRYPHKMEPAGDAIEVEEFPEGWPSDWLKTGYVRVVLPNEDEGS